MFLCPTVQCGQMLVTNAGVNKKLNLEVEELFNLWVIHVCKS